MKFATYAALVATAQASTGALNYNWSEDMQCPDFTQAENQIEFSQYGADSEGLDFENFKQKCAEAAYGWEAETAPCVGVMYLPSGFDYLGDGVSDQ